MGSGQGPRCTSALNLGADDAMRPSSAVWVGFAVSIQSPSADVNISGPLLVDDGSL